MVRALLANEMQEVEVAQGQQVQVEQPQQLEQEAQARTRLLLPGKH